VKCIRCNRDSRKKERVNGKCPGCRHSFAFDPTSGDVVTDAGFKAAIDAVSAGGSLRWGVEHLFYEINRRRRSKFAPIGCLVVFSVGLVLFLLGAIAGSPIALVPAAVFGLLVSLLAYERIRNRPLPFTMTVRIPQSKFDEMWRKWQNVHGKPEGVIIRKPTAKPRVPAAESDVSDYSFDRAVICDRARTVDLLLANNFHFENNCAVLSVEGYPEGPFETVRTMLQRNPRLQVFALHDATGPGCRLAYRLAHDRKWFPGHVIVDVGLRPLHAPPLHGLILMAAESVAPGDAVTQEEAEWLSKYSLELAAIRPEQVLKRLYRAINRRADDPDPRRTADNDSSSGSSGCGGGGGDGGRVDTDSDSFGADAGDGEGSADGFG
jgi:hypothetical protein